PNGKVENQLGQMGGGRDLMKSAYLYDEWFAVPALVPRHPSVVAALRYATECRIQAHEFFQFAGRSPAALVMWVSQELVVTGRFSQAALRLASSLENVHLRA